ncbi:hypothetical protein J2Q11_12975 [Tenacibaculum finnmarkense genomovar finnmarkense]|uniref:DUF7738 domain-containing protein n=1 Tax=Tenacibaculum finnmarkense TaxID=2781243 RepID=UPI001E4E43F4|nr:hypothetical protein [Tenacibaculum finnmarkense]MCD8418562.1 hypothetical protein [Tenacibaculum finnmarkense genomovar finnmarkense]MCD8455142.1 hypothetical protein [Tenacibaculum finnmarkense genomovar ulcerans]MCG8186920.1 hypothetical protein [Tenacibaculum finnmarkense genomovar finnmarkense]MCG8203458.1 hypothetical protein [Tenacibaculum finnmarkense genomovar finnmarkense]MCG8210929.1 hypothetical protein [Tenacibaculum finnmarkense genomovar finnmarkense]
MQTKKNTQIATEIQVNDKYITYKGSTLALDAPIKDWIKLLGEPDRNNARGKMDEHSAKSYIGEATDHGGYIWDTLGIVIAKGLDGTPEDGYYDLISFYIFYTNLESETGKKGWLDLARDFKDIEVINEMEDFMKKQFLEDEEFMKAYDKTNYAYPLYQVYKKPISIDGIALGTGIDFGEMNKRRKELDSIASFQYKYTQPITNYKIVYKEQMGDYYSNPPQDKSTKEYVNYHLRYNQEGLEYIEIVLEKTYRGY